MRAALVIHFEIGRRARLEVHQRLAEHAPRGSGERDFAGVAAAQRNARPAVCDRRRVGGTEEGRRTEGGDRRDGSRRSDHPRRVGPEQAGGQSGERDDRGTDHRRHQAPAGHAVVTAARTVGVRQDHGQTDRQRERVLPAMIERGRRIHVLREHQRDRDRADRDRRGACRHRVAGRGAAPASAGATAARICSIVIAPSMPLTMRPSRLTITLVGRPIPS